MSLTDDWKAERLKKEKDYFVKTLSNGKIYPAHLYDDNSFSFCGNRTEYFPVENTDIEVLATCDYKELYRLREEKSRCLTFWKWSQEGLRLIVIQKTLFG